VHCAVSKLNGILILYSGFPIIESSIFSSILIWVRWLSHVTDTHLRYLFIMKFVQLGTQIKTQCEKIYTKIHKKYIMKYIKNIKSTSDFQNSEIWPLWNFTLNSSLIRFILSRSVRSNNWIPEPKISRDVRRRFYREVVPRLVHSIDMLSDK